MKNNRILAFFKSKYIYGAQVYMGDYCLDDNGALILDDNHYWKDSNGDILIYDGKGPKEEVLTRLQKLYPNVSFDAIRTVEIPAMNDQSPSEKTIEIMNIIENFLEEQNITVPDDNRQGEDDEARLFGDTYYRLEDQIRSVIEQD